MENNIQYEALYLRLQFRNNIDYNREYPMINNFK